MPTPTMCSALHLRNTDEVTQLVPRGRAVLFERAKVSILYLYYMAVRFVRAKLEPRSRSMNQRLNALGKTYHIRMWQSAAASVGAVCRTEPGGVVEIENGSRSIRVRDNVTSLNEPAAVKRASDKAGMQALLAKSGVPVPRGIVLTVNEFDRALLMLQTARGALVVKPAESTGGGVGVSTNVTSLPRLRTTMAWARTFSRYIWLEEQVEGDCYRVLVMDGEVIDTVLRRPPRVVGDGVSTIRRLIHRENEARLKAAAVQPQVPIRFDLDLRTTLANQGLTLRSRPAEGEVIQLKRVINDNSALDNVPANGRLCRAILDAACRAAAIVGAKLAGVDVICTDPTAPLEVSGGAIIEVNATPGFYCHIGEKGASTFPAVERVLSKALHQAPAQA